MFDNIFQLRGVVIRHLEDITRLTGGCKKISPIEIAYREFFEVKILVLFMTHLNKRKISCISSYFSSHIKSEIHHGSK